ncbi:hypothetical protein DPMN_164959 [Dreissena polymorpha]|uniref:Uncharacterized protein n=1 Tax=Dreissena polymorpha TaxID=45954 RepID=A0A9D4IST6_DREPO|nr:hypothetical protein DPMN_164959 [Dreissena polymorpha]
MIIAGFSEAKVSGQKDICLQCMDFTFNDYLNECDSNALKELLILNKSNVRSLLLENNSLEVSKILAVLQQSKHSLERLKTIVAPELFKALNNLNIQELHFIGQIDESSMSDALTSLPILTYLCIEDSILMEQTVLPGTIQDIYLLKCTCKAFFLRRLLVYLSSLKHDVQLYLESVIVTDSHTPIFQSEILLSDMTNINLCIEQGNNDLYDILPCITIGKLSVHTAVDVSLASKIV